MTAKRHSAKTAKEAGMAQYDTRLATRVSSGVDQRLRQLALARRQRLCHVLDDLLDQALPTRAELAADLIQEKDGADAPR
jgi:hypothetical protein